MTGGKDRAVDPAVDRLFPGLGRITAGITSYLDDLRDGALSLATHDLTVHSLR